MRLQIGDRTAHNFDEPLGLLSDCHRRIEHFLQVFVAVARQASGGPLDARCRHALDGALRYFETAAPRHTADEEDSLFPRLRASGDAAAAQALALVQRLEDDHAVASAHHEAVNALVHRWLEQDSLAVADAALLRQHLTALQALYQAHIAVEDHELFPAAARVLDAAMLREMGREMAARRGVSA
jgi:hemerythrin-like domain-containing protein